jgi:hypothetical protein
MFKTRQYDIKINFKEGERQVHLAVVIPNYFYQQATLDLTSCLFTVYYVNDAYERSKERENIPIIPVSTSHLSPQILNINYNVTILLFYRSVTLKTYDVTYRNQAILISPKYKMYNTALAKFFFVHTCK